MTVKPANVHPSYIVNAYSGIRGPAAVEKGGTKVAARTARLLSLFGVDPGQAQPLDFGRKGWKCYGLRRADGSDPLAFVMLAESGPKSVAEIKKVIASDKDCVVFLASRNILFLRALGDSRAVPLDGEGEYERVCGILASCDISGTLPTRYLGGLNKAIHDIPKAAAYFDNRGIFSNHYLKNRLWDDLRRDVGPEAEAAGAAVRKGPEAMLGALGWGLDGAKKVGAAYRFGGASVVVAPVGRDLSTRTRDDVAPSYTAVAELKHSRWVILTNGRKWRLYTSRVSASTTNYLEIDSGGGAEPLRYLAALFGFATHAGDRPQIDEFFDQAIHKAAELEKDLRTKILAADGLFLDIVKGVLDHDMKRKFRKADLARAKETALAVMYRVWFILYAESRNLLPVGDPKYSPISLRSVHAALDKYEANPDGCECWSALLRLFECIRDGSPRHNLPQYNGGLFGARADVDGIGVRNRFIATALRSLLETDGQAVDYGNLGVRHLGSIYESLLEFDVRQADRDIMLLEDKGCVREVETRVESTYSYKKNDLYLVSGAGIAARKASASFYTPDEIVSFLVRRGLEPILEERQKKIAADMRKYKKDPSDRSRRACMDRILDLQVLDPAMGSGHFLVEALNRITEWAVGVLNSHPDHPLVSEIDKDRRDVIRAQGEKGVTIDQSLLTADVLLKRRIMKRCIFGVDLNGLAAELARLSLWLDSFAIGMPLTYLDHHVKQGDSTIGGRLADIKDPKDTTMDDWLSSPVDHGVILDEVANAPDITVEQARASKRNHDEYKKQTAVHRIVLDVMTASIIDPTVIPPKTKRKDAYVRRLAMASNKDKDALLARKRVDELAEKYSFFHWDLEMMDAFTDARRGFDLVVGNPPWEKPKPSKNEFFTPHDPAFRSLATNTKKNERAKELLENPEVARSYEGYLQSFRERGAFYKTFKLQGTGDRDMWQLVLERMLDLVADGGSISIVLPSQILGNTGSTDMRRRLLGMDIVQAYVFVNRKKIFPIVTSYRFLLLTARNRQDGPDEFPAAFYLHHLDSLMGGRKEGVKFTICSKRKIKTVSPKDLVIPEVSEPAMGLLERLSGLKLLGEQSDDGWQVSLSRGFDTTNDADLFKDDRKGWPVLKGKNMHQFNHAFSTPDFTTDPSDGLAVLEKKRVYAGRCRDFYESCMVVFRDVSGSTDLRTVIASIIPPHRFHANSLYSIVVVQNHRINLDDEYNRKIAYLCGVLNSMTFDFIVRSKARLHISTIIKTMSVPSPSQHDDEIASAVARLTCSRKGAKRDFAAFAESLGIKPKEISPAERIDTTARLDALVAHAYGLSRDEYRMVLDSFKFGEDPALLSAETADWSDNKVLRRFYGEVRKAAMPHFEAIAKAGRGAKK